MRKLFSIFAIVLLYVGITFGQAAVSIPITVSDNQGGTKVLNFGFDPTATTGIDPALGESDLPPFPPAGVFEARWSLQPFGVGNLSTYSDYRTASPPFTGQIIHRLLWQYTDLATQLTISYNLPVGVELLITSNNTTPLWTSGPRTGSGTFVLDDAGNEYTAARVFITYTNYPPAPGPFFAILPAALSFPSVYLGTPTNLPVTISNGGATNPLNITDIVSSNAQFTFIPNSFPIIVAPGGSQVVTVTFNPTALGLQSGTLTFTHNAPGSPSVYNVSGTGADPAPVFGVNPASLNFGSVSQGGSSTLQVTVSNTGVNPLNITSAATAAPYTVSPLNAVIPAGGSQVFNVTFAPIAGGTFNNTLTFVHNAAGSPSNVSLTGTGLSVFGLIFANEEVYNKEDSSYTEVMQLKSLLGGRAQAIQFRLLVNKSADDNTFLTFQNITKGTDVAASNWVLQYNVFRGPITGNGASVDSIYVLLYDLNQNGGLAPGVDYNNLLNVRYRVADLPALVDTAKSSFRITNAEASTFQGFPLAITPSRAELKVFATNRVALYGDVNGDGVLDILDLIDVVDHILGRDSLNAAEFARADIAPWTIGNATPNPDGFVNVMDLALIQNIILTGIYPDGTTLNNRPLSNGNPVLAKGNGEVDAKVILYINNQGITVHTDSKYDLRGVQLELANVVDDPSNMTVNTDLGDAYYLRVNDLLRVLLYDRLAEKTIPAGKHFVAAMPFEISNPEEILIDKVILVNTDKNKLTKILVEVVYGGSPEIPIDYALFQNYPNPFNPNTSVRFQVPQTGLVTIKLYDVIGREVATLFSDMVERGTYNLLWDGRDNSGKFVSSGTYIYRMTAGDFIQSKKMMFIK